MSNSIGTRIATGAALMVLLKIAVRLVGFASILVLARVLSPEDFGIVAIAFVTVSILENLTEPLVQPYLIRAERPDRDMLDAAWTLNMLRGGTIGAAVALAAPLVGQFMDEPRVVPLMLVFALGPILQGLENIGMVMRMRELRYDVVLVWRLSSKIVATLTTVPLAILFASYWALVAGILAGRLAAALASYGLSDYRPKLRLRGTREMVHFARWMFGYGALDTIESYLMTVMLGRLSGPASVGTFNVAYTIGSMPCSEIFAPVREPLYVGLSAAKDNPAALRQRYLDGLALSVMIVLPLSLGIAIIAPLAVPIALGSGWRHTVALVQICAIYALIDAINAFTMNVFIALGCVRRMVATFAALLGLRIPAAIFGFYAGGTEGAALGLVAAAVVGLVAWHAQTLMLVGIAVRALLAGTWRSLCAGLAMIPTVLLILHGIPLAQPPMTLLILGILGGGLTFVGTQMALWHAVGRPPGPEQQGLDALHGLGSRLAHIWARA